jgi:hypothetical protein
VNKISEFVVPTKKTTSGRILSCCIIYSEILVEVDRLGVIFKVKVIDRKFKFEVIDNKSRGYPTRGSQKVMWKPIEYQM